MNFRETGKKISAIWLLPYSEREPFPRWRVPIFMRIQFVPVFKLRPDYRIYIFSLARIAPEVSPRGKFAPAMGNNKSFLFRFISLVSINIC